jgi:hypothetical protein
MLPSDIAEPPASLVIEMSTVLMLGWAGVNVNNWPQNSPTNPLTGLVPDSVVVPLRRTPTVAGVLAGHAFGQRPPSDSPDLVAGD